MEEIDLSFEIDLHYFSPKDTDFILNEFISFNIMKGIKEVKIIHGKGKSVKKHAVIRFLSSDVRVKSYHDDSSNWGSTIAELFV
ncbi:MAG: Smr/MutS family protein [Spirochaetes bacterium]|nr:Smr/MutS family protein [Spirochaetota bacterium]